MKLFDVPNGVRVKFTQHYHCTKCGIVFETKEGSGVTTGDYSTLYGRVFRWLIDISGYFCNCNPDKLRVENIPVEYCFEELPEKNHKGKFSVPVDIIHHSVGITSAQKENRNDKPILCGISLKDPKKAAKKGIAQKEDGLYLGNVKVLDNVLLVK